MLNWRRGWVNLQWVYVNCDIYICNVCGVLVFQRSICNGRREWGQSAMGICTLCYICQVWCSIIQGIYAQLEEGVGSVCHGYMFILLDMKLMWCSGFPEIYAHLEGVGSVCHDDFSLCALYYICNCFGVVVLHRSIVNWRRGGQSPCQLTLDACYTIIPH